jgi:two-component system OmpR family sensor kinase
MAAMPAGLGLLAAWWMSTDQRPDPILHLRADLPAVITVLSLAFLIVSGVVLMTVSWVRRQAAKRVGEARFQAAEERRRLLRRLDHEFKNPLMAIRAGLANLVPALVDPAQQETAASIESQALRLGRLTADMRKLVELETRPLEQAQVDLAHMLEEVIAAAREQPEAQDRHLQLAVPRVPWPLPEVRGDGDLLALAVHNLVDNALKFSEPGSVVEVRGFEDGTAVVIEVADTGTGMPAEEIPLVWEELYRGRHARATSGSGIGLALVRAVVERHGGQVSIQSREGQGTVVRLRIPTR